VPGQFGTFQTLDFAFGQVMGFDFTSTSTDNATQSFVSINNRNSAVYGNFTN
jgi:hypothetical protein